jgi:hypothetical protein
VVAELLDAASRLDADGVDAADRKFGPLATRMEAAAPRYQSAAAECRAS